ncbi:MAG: proline dehydrogenase [Bacteroidetes bacterium SW_10_40_5]|nr:MAG: proline dehydrogenase [Bacteroidetes bacterium SW_10_40_5]
MIGMAEINFKDTEIAYQSKSNQDLYRGKYLFKLLQNPILSKPGQIGLKLAVKFGLPVNGIIKNTLYRQFIGGETLDDCKKLADQLANYNVYTILDYALEGKEEEAEFERATEEFARNIDYAAEAKNIPFSVFKPSAIASNKMLENLSSQKNPGSQEKQTLDKLRERFEFIFNKAYKLDVSVMVDAEETWMQPIIDQLVIEMMEKYNKEKALVINTFQLYRKDRLNYLKQCYEYANKQGFYLGVKLVRGAYLEKELASAAQEGYESPVYDQKEDTDRDYNEAIKFCLDHIDQVLLAVASHNELSTSLTLYEMEERNIDPQHVHVWFSQLYGMCDYLTFNMGKEGYNVAKYIPYGKVKAVVPYLLRRAEENSSITGQVQKELDYINQELQRRKAS